MKKRQVYVWLAVVGLAGSVPLSGFSQGEANRLYRMQEGDTLAELAEVYFGGKEFVPELLEFNNIKNPTAVGAGALLALPGSIRADAITRVARAEEAVALALAAAADKYAPVEYKAAKSSLETSKRFRLQAAYAKAVGLAERTIAMAEEAKRIADKNANVSKDGRISDVYGTVQISTDQGKNWKKVSQNDPLPLTAIIRTDAGSRAEVILEDGSVFQVLESSELSIAQYLKDRRSGKINAELRVLMGDIMGKIKPKDQDDSQLNIETGKASIAVRGTRLRAKVDAEGVTRMELLSGKVDLHAGGRTIHMTANYGVVAPPERNPGKPTELLPPPAIVDAWAGDVTTATQRPRLAWNKVKNRKLDVYHVEVATDKDFNHIVQNEFVEETALRTKLLPEGDYLWRVSSIDKKRLEGDSSEPRRLHIRKDLDVAVEYKGALVETDGKLYASAANTYQARPLNEDTSVVELEYSVDGGDFQQIDGELRLEDGGDRVLRVRGTGLEGDSGAEQILNVFVDGTPPEISMELSRPVNEGEDGTWVLARIETADDSAIAKLRYSLDGRTFQNYEEPIRLSTLQNYKMIVWSRDVLGNSSGRVYFDVRGELVPRGENLRPLPFRL